MKKLEQPRTTAREIADAVAAVREDTRAVGHERDAEYFAEHEPRFAHAARRVAALSPAGSSLLDVGSHYLHLSSILSRLGYHVIGVDGAEHVRLPFVIERARRFGVDNRERAADDLQQGHLVPDWKGDFHGVLFCEIMEHITFNPILFWRRIHELLPAGGWVYITTPNGLKLLSVLGSLWNLLSLRRVGIRTQSIFDNATYGHHWKEYGARELREYFARLSPDFDVAVRGLSYGPPSPMVREVLGPFKTFLLEAGNNANVFAENLEAIVTVSAKTPWTTTAPDYA